MVNFVGNITPRLASKVGIKGKHWTVQTN